MDLLELMLSKCIKGCGNTARKNRSCCTQCANEYYGTGKVSKTKKNYSIHYMQSRLMAISRKLKRERLAKGIKLVEEMSDVEVNNTILNQQRLA